MQSVRSLTRVIALAFACSTTLAFADGAPIVRGSLQITEYDGVIDDLLSAGLNQAGLMGAAPGFTDPNNPTPAELRRRAIHSNYRGIVDPALGGGMGLLWGPRAKTARILVSRVVAKRLLLVPPPHRLALLVCY